MREDRELQGAAVAAEAEGQRGLLAGQDAEAAFEEAARLYRRSWEVAPPGAYGRLVGMLKAAIIAGEGEEFAAYALGQLADGEGPTASYARALAALLTGDDDGTAAAAAAMHEGGEAFARAADALAALADGDREAYARAVAAVVADFEARELHLTGVPFADTALMLEKLAEPRGLAAHPSSRLLPPL